MNRRGAGLLTGLAVVVVVTGGLVVTVMSDDEPSIDPTEQTGPAQVPEPTGQVRETPDEFFSTFEAAFQKGDVGTLLRRLHPAVIELHGAAQCRELLRSLPRDRTVEIVEVYEPEGWFYGTSDGADILIENAIRVDIIERVGDQEVSFEAHLAPADDGTLRWFTDCGDPVS